MRSVVRAFLNSTSYVYVELVKRSTFVVLERNGELFLAPNVEGYQEISHSANSLIIQSL